MMRHWLGRRGSRLLMALTIGCAVLTGVAVWRLSVIQSTLPPEVTENAVWGAAASEIELVRFLDALGQYALASETIDQGKLLERFDLLWSRLDLFRSGELAASIVDAPDLQASLEEMRGKLAALDALVGELAPGDVAGAAAIRAGLEGHLPALRAVTMHNLNNDHAGRIHLRAMREKEQWTTAIVVLLVAVLGLLVVVLVRGESSARWFLARIRSTKAEAEQAQRRLVEAIQCLDEGVALYDAADRLVLCNSHYRQLFGPVADRVVAGARFADLLRAAIEARHLECPDDVEDFIVEQIRLRWSAQGHGRNTQLMRGRWFWIENRTTADGGLISLVADITEEKQRELALTAAHTRLEHQAAELAAMAEKAQRASAAKSQFLAMISHEIRTPLSGMLGAIQLLADRPMADEDRRLLMTAQGSGEMLLVVLNDILDFTRIEAGKLTLRPAPFNTAELVQGVADLYQAPARTKGIELAVRIGPDVPAWLVGDASRIRQMLLNYVSNAMKFTASGAVTLAVERVAGSGAVRFLVADTGPGIPAERHQDLFSDFVQLEGATTRQPDGAGLGLAITRRLAELMKGRVGLDSAPGRGSMFWFELPLEADAGPPKNGAPAAAGAPDQLTYLNRAPRILVAEDNKTNQLIVRSMLQRLGCQVAVVENGAEALDAVQHDAYDLVLTDVSMPVMDGLEASRRIRELGTLPIVALTADITVEEGENLRRHGINACITKPASPSKLRQSLAAMLAAA